jgi:uncharacterized protein (TIGR03382 family)
MSRSLRNHTALLVLVVVCAVARPAGAIVISLWDFDGNNHASASSASAGNFGVDSGTFGWGPNQGASQGLLQSSGGAATGTVESDLGIDNNAIRQIFNKGVRQPGFTVSGNNDVDRGSGFRITFDALAGDVLEFDWNMFTDETTRAPVALATYTDFAWWDLSGADKADGALANVNDGSFGSVSGTPYDQHTGSQTAQITLTSGGTYTIAVGVNDIADANFASALTLDFFRLVRGPEPGTFGTVAGGLMALSWLSRRRSRLARGR